MQAGLPDDQAGRQSLSSLVRTLGMFVFFVTQTDFRENG